LGYLRVISLLNKSLVKYPIQGVFLDLFKNQESFYEK